MFYLLLHANPSCSRRSAAVSHSSQQSIIFINMLPELSRKRSEHPSERGSLPKFSQGDLQLQDLNNNPKSSSAKKVRTGGGFMKSNQAEDVPARQGPDPRNYQQTSTSNFAKGQRATDLAAEIKLIERKIKACQKKLEADKKRERMLAEEQSRDPTQPQYDFEKVVERELQMQGYGQDNEHNFDYLTNPKLNPADEQEQDEPAVVEQPKPSLLVRVKPYSIDAGLEKLQKFYENSLKKKFERREMFPHQPCRRKTPKLYITQKTNALEKHGKAQTETEHLFRVLTKETTPQEIYPTIPNFAVVKDALSKNIVAYLGDYKPFLDKTKEAKAKKDSGIQPNRELSQSANQQNRDYSAEIKASDNVQSSTRNRNIKPSELGIL